jgi:subtilase family serine protease
MWIPMTIKKLSHSSLTALAFSMALALAAAASTTVQAGAITNNGLGAAVASATALATGDVSTGVLPHTQPMHIVVALKLRNSDQLSSLIAAHQTLTPAQFLARHAPTQLQAQAVATYLTQLGFTHVVIAPNRLLVSADGTAGTAQAAFQTSFARVQTHDGRAAFANTSDAHMPTSLQDGVLSVIGLQNVHQAHSFAQRLQPNAITGAAGSVTGHNPNEFPAIYNATGLPTAAGVTVGIIAVGEQSQTITDLNTFTDNNHLNRVITQVVATGGTAANADLGEFDLDSQDIVGAGGGQVGKIIFYTDPDWSFVSLIDNFNTAVTANVAKVINVSIGGCENDAQSDGSAAASDQVFQAAVAQGQTFSVSTGDKGANECLGEAKTGASWPASSPYVVAVAGTTLTASTTAWGSETVWNICDGGDFCASGGSPSTFEPKPSWQNALVSGNTRGVADIAFDADANSGALIVINGGYQQWGGTSLASPIFVGFWARVIAAKGTAVGFAAPLLYQLPAADLHDVTVGNNNGYQAKAGYDFASGRGSLIMSSVINDIGVVGPPPPPPPLVANFSYTTSGLIAKFVDTSTDSSNPITAHAWTFGDGGTSRIASPSHAYLKAGTYAVNETVTDSTGLAENKTASVTIK